MNPADGIPAIVEQVNILIVDDEPKNLLVLESVLDDPRYRLIRANSGEEALLQLVTHEFAVLVLDVRMPGMTGFELALMIKERKKTSGIPIIFLTAYYNEDQHILEGYGKGAVDYLHKPVNAAVLRSKVSVFAELFQRGRALEAANRALLAEVSERRRAEARLKELNATLDRRVTERTEALQASEAQLRDANRRKDDFLATLAHELRNPLAPVRNAAQLLGSQGLDPDKQAWASAMIDRQVSAMSRLIDDLMDVSRINQGKIELQKRTASLGVIVRDVIESVRPLVDGCGHELTLTQLEENLALDADTIRLSQAFMNLLNNAAKYTERGGKIAINVSRVGDEAVISVMDNGIGIPSDRLESVFGMFSQVETALTRSRGGLGIGLSLSRRLIEMHGGTVVARSDGLGRGSEFLVKLPLSMTATSPSTAPPAMPQPVPSSAPAKVLVADDNEDAAATLAVLLELMGYEVRHVHDGEAAVAAAAEFQPAIALIDIGMPKLNGYQACERIRQLPNGPEISIVAITGWGQPEDRRKSAEAGFDRHLVKPVDPAELTALLAELAATHAA